MYQQAHAKARGFQSLICRPPTRERALCVVPRVLLIRRTRHYGHSNASSSSSSTSTSDPSVIACPNQQLQVLETARTRGLFSRIVLKWSDQNGKVGERKERRQNAAEDIPRRSKSKVPFAPPAPASPTLSRMSLSVRLASTESAWASLLRAWSSRAERGLRGVTGSSRHKG